MFDENIYDIDEDLGEDGGPVLVAIALITGIIIAAVVVFVI